MCPISHSSPPRFATAPPSHVRLPALLATLFLHLLPSIFFGIVALILDEAARLINFAAAFFQLPVPTALQTPLQNPAASDPPTTEHVQNPLHPNSRVVLPDHPAAVPATRPRNMVFVKPYVTADLPPSTRRKSSFPPPSSKPTPKAPYHHSADLASPDHNRSHSKINPSSSVTSINPNHFLDQPLSSPNMSSNALLNASTFVSLVPSSVTPNSSTSSIPPSFMSLSKTMTFASMDLNASSYPAPHSSVSLAPSRSRSRLIDRDRAHQSENRPHSPLHPDDTLPSNYSPPTYDQSPVDLHSPPDQYAEQDQVIHPSSSHRSLQHEQSAAPIPTSTFSADVTARLKSLDAAVVSMESPHHSEHDLLSSQQHELSPSHHDHHQGADPPSRVLPGRFVSQRVNEYETLETITPVQVPMPPSPVLCALYASELQSVPDQYVLDGGSHAQDLHQARAEDIARMEGPVSPTYSPYRGAGAIPLFREGDSESSEGGSISRGESMHHSTSALHIRHVTVTPVEPIHSMPPIDTMQHVDNMMSEAPTGAQGLRDLIPRNMPRGRSLGNMNTTGASVQSDSFARMDNATPVWMPMIRSEVSLHTEAYPSPESPSSVATSQNNSYGRIRTSYRKDQDVFSEEPSMTYDRPLRRQTPSLESAVQENGGFVDSPTSELPDMNVTTIVDDEYESEDSVEDNMEPVLNERIVTTLSRRAEERRGTTAVSSEDEDDDEEVGFDMDENSQTRWSAYMARVDRKETKRRMGKSGKSKKGIAEDVLFRQASIDVTSLPSTRRHDRPRDDTRFSREYSSRNGIGTSRVPVMPTKGRPLPGQNIGRSMSTSGARTEDWPEYSALHRNDSGQMSRRHASDVSFGVTDRQLDLLPAELLRKADDGDFWNDEGLPERFGGGRGWRKRFGRHGPKESTEGKGVMRNLLRRRRTGDQDGSGSGVRFESVMKMNTVFPLINRICTECGFRVMVTRGTHKLKMEVPCGGDLEPLLVSVGLSKIHGRNIHTMVSLCRSKDDISGGPFKEIESACMLLRKRLEAHVEFIEDSCTSLYLDSSGTEVS